MTSSNKRHLAAMLVLVGTLVSCRNEMYDQPKYTVFQGSDYFPGGSSTLEPVSGTQPRGNKPSEPLPPLAILERGRDRYDIYCTPCHGYLGDGSGEIVLRGFPPPPSFHEERLRQEPAEYFTEVARDGLRSSPRYGLILSEPDLHAIGRYIKALQLSQHFEAARLDDTERTKLENGDVDE